MRWIGLGSLRIRTITWSPVCQIFCTQNTHNDIYNAIAIAHQTLKIKFKLNVLHFGWKFQEHYLSIVCRLRSPKYTNPWIELFSQNSDKTPLITLWQKDAKINLFAKILSSGFLTPINTYASVASISIYSLIFTKNVRFTSSNLGIKGWMMHRDGPENSLITWKYFLIVIRTTIENTEILHYATLFIRFCCQSIKLVIEIVVFWFEYVWNRKNVERFSTNNIELIW